MEGSTKCCGTKLCSGALGIALGVLSALFALLLGLAAWHFKYGESWVNLMSSIYIGYGITPKGILFGVLWGFLEGFICGLIIGWVYNLVCKCCSCKICKPK